MGRNWDEPFSLYGLLAESIETGPAREWVEFTLRPEARFSDGTPVTVEDVIWSMETLAEKGLPRYRNAWEKVTQVEQTGERSLRFTFDGADSELPLIIGLRPILKKADWEGLDFAASSLRVPVGSGPYVIDAFEPGRYISFRRNPDYWGRDLPLNRGVYNFDTIRYEYFVDAGVLFQAFTAGDLSVYRELNPARWAGEYGFPAVKSGAGGEGGDPARTAVGHGGVRLQHAPPDLRGLAGARRADPRLQLRVHQPDGERRRPAAAGELLRQLGARHGGRAGGGARAGAARAVPRQPGAGRARCLCAAGLGRVAAQPGEHAQGGELLEQAGWRVQEGQLRNAAGEPFTFEILLQQGQSEAVANIFADALRQLGITVRVQLVDQAQYNERRTAYDYDMIVNAWSMSLSPGNEQTLYWGRDGVTAPGTRNYMGVDSPAAEAMIAEMLATRDPDGFVAAVQALDRVLTTGRYVIPFWFSDKSLIAHKADLKHPEKLPVYGDWIGWLPEVWWQDPR